MDQLRTEIAIIGAGSVGLTFANLLGTHGIRTVVIERDAAHADAPRAVGIDDESLRAWQAAGVLDAILPHVAAGSEGDIVLSYLTARGKRFFHIRQYGQPLGFPRGATFIQQLADVALERGLARFPHVRLQRGVAVTSVEQEAGGVILHAGSRTVRADYVVACDGARSPTRERLGIPMPGFTYDNRWLVVDGHEPREHPEAISTGVEVWAAADRPTASVPLPHGLRRWEFLLRANERDAEALRDDFIHALLRKRGGPDVRIVRRRVYTFSARVAAAYRSGRVFLAGDAAHVTPPFAAQGLTSGLRDALNLAWKLALVVRGRASARLLNSYEIERRPHQERMIRLAVSLGLLMTPKHRTQAALMAGAIGAATRVPLLREAMSMRGAALQPRYRAGFVSRGALAGRYLPQPRVRASDGRELLLDELLGPGFALVGVGCDPSLALNASSRAFLRHLGLNFVEIVDREPSKAGEAKDLGGAFARWLQRDGPQVFIVRPDRFVFADGKPGRADERVASLRHKLGG
ncbi:MAG: bifunctional 3-(3-hydroxy-phenyl)propionate/3-hydroxycinnamic acid hydroxylase [Verrucomicrobia bacterium]|nr:bifunctional 3-(3-hydroxy-phenyl)propionate/3-hydroxycinnamic acid hydroxylase [Verrucomicrobiota bacterium]